MRELGREHPFLMGSIVSLSAASLAGSALAPALLTHAPLCLIALSPIGRHLILVATVVPFASFVIVAALRRALASYLAYNAGEFYGERALDWLDVKSPKWGRWMRALERLFAKRGGLLLVVLPGLTTAALAGVARMPAPKVVGLLLLGQVSWMALTFYLGAALSTWTDPIVAFIQSHVMEATAVCAALVMGYQLVRRRLRPRALDDIPPSTDLPL